MKSHFLFGLLLICAALPSALRGQSSDTDIDEYRAQFNFLTQQLDLSAASTGLLLEKNGALINLGDVDGQSTGPGSVTDLDQFG